MREPAHEPPTPKRCAIYTRKSFQPPLGQEVTSLESQRAICASYVASQQHRGWIELGRFYDDSGRTGADTHRPALQRLLADVEAGLIDVVLVYKLDRLTRTLLDFVRLSDFLSRHDVALVSITQNFDTSDSLGRLVLNVLLTFAQFEREILSDRMKDKIRVLKQMGRWVGGSPPLGYDIVRGRLVENCREGEAVRTIFSSYFQLKNTEAVHRLVEETGFRRKVWKARAGTAHGGGPITLSSLHHSADARLVHLLDEAAAANKYMVERRDLDLPSMAQSFGCKTDRFARLIRLNYLAPDIALAIRDGEHPAGMTRRGLLKTNLPLDWAVQRSLLGFPAQPEHFRNPNMAQPQEHDRVTVGEARF